ncbi:MAG: TolC family outer membrane protein [Acetobacteraceae bacterium]|nr:TolC family outer membrane protein [Acetobacteraceae bacterium]
MRLGGIVTGFALVLAAGAAPAQAQVRTLQDALAAAYANNPQIQAARAQLRATDENVPQALAGWRPTVVVSGSLGYGEGTYRTFTPSEFGFPGGFSKIPNERDIAEGAATLTQPLYRGGQTQATTHQATNQVYAQRASLMATEEQLFVDTINAYVGVIQSEQLLQLNINNEQVLTKQLQATQDRFRVGEITRTDVAQAEAALAGARATRQTSEGNLQTARATYVAVIGEYPQPNLVKPQPLRLPVRNEGEADQLAATNNPNVIAALFSEAAAKDAVDVAFSQLMPQVSLQAQGARDDNTQVAHTRIIGAQVLLNASVPLYQGGAEYSKVRQARQTREQATRQVDNARRTAIQAATQSWETLVAARSTIDSTRAQVRANAVALEGVEREAIVGSRTTLDVLNAQQALLNSQVTLVQNLSSLITASYAVAFAVGRLTARDLNLNVPLYDDTAYYRAVRDRLFGTGDYATRQPGR